MISQYDEVLDSTRNPLVLAILPKKSGDVIGHVGLSPYYGEIEIGYAIVEEHCGKGYATQAVTEMSKWAVCKLNLSRIYGIALKDNRGSGRVLEKAGYTLEEESLQNYHGQARLCQKYCFQS